MNKQKKAGDKRGKVGKSGSPPSNSRQEKVRGGKGEQGLPKVSKKDIGSGRQRGGRLH